MSSGEGFGAGQRAKNVVSNCDIIVKSFGEVSEWFKEHAWKACMRATVSGVRIPISPPEFPHRGIFYFATNYVKIKA